MPVEAYLDCCHTPRLETVRSISDSSHDSEELMQCRTCGAYWFYRFHEHVDFSGGDDAITAWYSPVTQEEATQIMQSDQRPDLTFLQHRPALIEDEHGVRRTIDQPTEPW